MLSPTEHLDSAKISSNGFKFSTIVFRVQHLLVQCDDFCRKHSITFNVSKSICIFFKSAVNRKCDTTDLFLSSKAIDFVQETKYLGALC